MKEVPQSQLGSWVSEGKIPLRATIELTHRCNLRCVHCYIGERPTDELSTREVFSVIDQLAEAGTIDITFTGGEALVRDDFFDIAAYGRRRHMSLTLLSNGTLIDEAAVDSMRHLHFSDVYVSLYGSTAETHDGITRRAGSFARTVQAIRLLSRGGIKVHASAMAMKPNLKELASLSGLFSEIGVKVATDPHVSPAIDGSTAPLRYRLGDEALREYLLWRATTGKEDIGYARPCHAGRSMVCISARGEVFPCVGMRLTAGDLRREPFRRIWSESSVFLWLRGLSLSDFRACSECKLLGVCNRCQGIALAEEGSVLARCRETCRITRTIQEVKDERERCSSRATQEV